MAKNIPFPVLRRLPRYFRMFCMLQKNRVERISSSELAELMGLTASQVRQDFSCFGRMGQQGYGYNVDKVLEELMHVLMMDIHRPVILVGVGLMGRTLLKNVPFGNLGYIVDAVFDVDKSLIGTTVEGYTVRPVDELEKYIEGTPPYMAIITVPISEAEKTASRLYRAGVRGFWNFTTTDLKLNDDAIIESPYLGDNLMVLGFRIATEGKTEENSI